MVNRIPLVLDVEDGNKIKELPAGDNLNLSENNIVNVQDINALGTINAAIITVNGERLVAQNFLDLTDGPNTYVGSEDYFVKVNETGTGLEFRPIQDIGNLVIDTITISEKLEPTADNLIEVGTEANKIAEVWAYGLRGSLVGYDGTLVFDAETNKISYAALQGAPTVLSEFINDVGYLRLADLDAQWQALFEGGRAIGGDLVGSVFSNDSVLMVDALDSKIRGDIEFTTSTGYIEGETIAILPNETVDLGSTRLIANMTPVDAEAGSIGTELLPFNDAHFVNGTIRNFTTNTLDINNEIGLGVLYGTTDLILDAGNRVKLADNVPFKVGRFDATELTYLVGQTGDIIYNKQTNKYQLYQDTDGTVDWISLHAGLFEGNVKTTTGESNFNDVVIIGDLTVSGTTTTVDTANTTIKDNTIVLNDGEVGAGVTATTSGIEIDRGSESNVSLVWDDSVDKWTIGSQILTADAFESVAVRTSLIDTNGPGPLQIKVGATTDTGNTIFINPYGSDTVVQTKAETHYWDTGAYLSTGNPYMKFTTVGAFEALDGAYFKGNLIGDITGSIFGDDSTVLVDGVNSKILGDVDATNVDAGTVTATTVYSSAFYADGQTGAVVDIAGAQNLGGAGGGVFIRGGTGSTVDGAINISGGGFSVITSDTVSITSSDKTGSAGISMDIGAGNSTDQDGGGILFTTGNGETAGGDFSVTAGDAANGDAGNILFTAGNSTTTGSGGDITLQAGDNVTEIGIDTDHGGDINLTSGTSVNGKGGDINLTSGTSTNSTGGDLNLDAGAGVSAGFNGVINFGTVNAKEINIGNNDSAIVMDGTLQISSALIVNNLIADDSISITTAVGDGNAISIGPQGTNRIINLVGDDIRINGEITTNLDAAGGVTGDVIGSVFSQDSVLLVDALDGILRGNIDNGSSGTINTGTATVETAIKAQRLTNLTPGITDLTVEYSGTVDINGGDGSPGVSNITLDKLGTSYINITSEPGNPAIEDALVSINATAAAGDVQIGTTVSSRNQIVRIYNAQVNGNVTGTVDGTLTGSVLGSVFADDSAVMVDGANYVMFSDAMNLTPLIAEPTDKLDGMLVSADGVNWDPAGKAGAVSYPVYYDGAAWHALY